MPLTSSAPFVRDPPSYSETPQPGETSIFLETVSPSKHQSNFDYGACKSCFVVNLRKQNAVKKIPEIYF